VVAREVYRHDLAFRFMEDREEEFTIEKYLDET